MSPLVNMCHQFDTCHSQDRERSSENRSSGPRKGTDKLNLARVLGYGCSGQWALSLIANLVPCVCHILTMRFLQTDNTVSGNIKPSNANSSHLRNY